MKIYHKIDDENYIDVDDDDITDFYSMSNTKFFMHLLLNITLKIVGMVVIFGGLYLIGKVIELFDKY